MSGGSFDYACFRVQQFADDLQERIDENGKEDDFGFSDNYAPETIAELQKAQKLIETAGKIAREVEWLYSGDISEETYLDRVGKILSSDT